MAGSYLGDFLEDATVHFMWDSNDASGASITRSTDGVVSVYKDNGVTQSVAGVTDTEDFDTLTGVHVCTIDTGADAFYAAGADYTVVLSGAVIDGQTVNAVLAHFSIQNRSTMTPIRTGTAQGGTFGSITLDASASVENSFYKGFCQITGGLGVGQSRPIVGYDGTTKVLEISPPWSTIPDDTSEWSIWPRGYDPASVLTESYAALSAAPTLEQALFAIQQGVLDFKVVGTTLTLRKLNGTDAMTFTLNNAAAPTDRVRAT